MAISYNTIPENIKVPLFYAEVDPSQANTGANDLVALVIGQMTEGTAEAGKPVLVSSDSQGKEYFGRGSMLATMLTAYYNNNTLGQVWALPLADPKGGSKASGTFTFTGTASSAGTVFAYIGATRVPVAVAQGATAKEAAEALAAAINAKQDLPMTAQATEGKDQSVVTVNAKNAGVLGNDIKLSLNFNGVAAGEVLPEGLMVEVSKVAGGAGTIDFAVVKKALGDEQYDFIAFPYADLSLLNEMKLEMNDSTGRWSPMRQLYGHVYSAKRGTVQDLVSFGNGLNDQHLTVMGVEVDMPNSPVEVLGAYVAKTHQAIQNDPARPTQTLELAGITSPKRGERFSLNDKQTLLSNGIATNACSNTAVMIERAVTTYRVNAFGVADTSYQDSETLHTLSYVIRDLKSVITSKFPRHKLANDGTKFGAGQAIVTPSIIKGEILAEYAKLEAKGIVENLEVFKKALIVERHPDNPNRINVLLPADLVNQLRVFAMLAQFRLQSN